MILDSMYLLQSLQAVLLFSSSDACPSCLLFGNKRFEFILFMSRQMDYRIKWIRFDAFSWHVSCSSYTIFIGCTACRPKTPRVQWCQHVRLWIHDKTKQYPFISMPLKIKCHLIFGWIMTPVSCFLTKIFHCGRLDLFQIYLFTNAIKSRFLIKFPYIY